MVHHVNPLVHLINIMDHLHQIHHQQFQIHHQQLQIHLQILPLILQQKEFYKLLHVKIVQQDVLLVKVPLHANHVVQDIPYQDLHVMLISQENYKLEIFS